MSFFGHFMTLDSMAGSASKTAWMASHSCRKACRSCGAKSRNTGRPGTKPLQAENRISDFQNEQHPTNWFSAAIGSASAKFGRPPRVRHVLDHRRKGDRPGGSQADNLALAAVAE